MTKYYVNLLTRRDRKHYTTLQMDAKDINDLRKKLIAKGYVEDYPRIEVISSNNRVVGILEYVDVTSTSIWPGQVNRHKGHYVIWLHLLGKPSSFTTYSFVEPLTGKLKDTGYTYVYPDFSKAKNPTIKPVR